MPVTGSFNTAKMTKGPGTIYFDVGVPGAGLVVSLTAGVPANGKHMGYTPEGNTISVGFEQEEVNVDEATTAIETIVSAETLSIAGSAHQIADFQNVTSKILPQSTLGAGPPERLTFGGKTALSTIDCMIIVWASKADPTKFFYFTLYNPMNTDASSFQVTRTAYASLSYSFLGRAIGSRAAGDQIGALVLEA
jgi:hypothetical protein